METQTQVKNVVYTNFLSVFNNPYNDLVVRAKFSQVYSLNDANTLELQLSKVRHSGANTCQAFVQAIIHYENLTAEVRKDLLMALYMLIRLVMGLTESTQAIALRSPIDQLGDGKLN